jgi:hypothetical protein
MFTGIACLKISPGISKLPTFYFQILTAFLNLPTSSLKLPTGFLKLPTGFLKLPTGFLKKPTCFCKIPTGFLKKPTCFSVCRNLSINYMSLKIKQISVLYPYKRQML